MTRTERRVEKKSKQILDNILEVFVESKQYTPKQIADQIGLDFTKGSEDRTALSDALTKLTSTSLLVEKNGKFIRPVDHTKHHNDLIVGVVNKKGAHSVFVPADATIDSMSLESCNVPDGHIVSVRPTNEFNNVARIVVDHGSLDQTAGINKMVFLSKGMPIEFSQEAMTEVMNMTVPPISAKHKDLTRIPFITIDPVTAKDFDDAICVRKKGRNLTVQVAVADVDHYVRPGMAVYDEALLRGNSTYTEGYTNPMIPTPLSDGLCSLQPDELRAAVVLTIEIDPHGKIVKKDVERGLIRSRARLTYEQVQEAIDNDDSTLDKSKIKEGIKTKEDKFVQSIYNKYIKKDTRAAYKILRAEREARGALDLNVYEQRNDISEKGVVIAVEKGNEAHAIIEELMILANRAAIELLDEANSNYISRVHGEPNEEALNEKAPYLEKLGMQINTDLPVTERVRDIVQQAKGHKNEDKIKRIMIRIQARAAYKEGSGNHYGLALSRYGHFTSPIRRFADLIGHHQLHFRGKPEQEGFSKEEMEKIAAHISKTERLSQEIEIECSKRFAAKWVAGHLGENFNARVISKDENEITVQVSHPNIKTVMNVADGESYGVGDEISITPTAANVITGIIEFKRASGAERANDNDAQAPHGVDGAGTPYKARHPRPRMKERRFANV